MGLTSKLFIHDGALDACLARDAAHVTPGARGAHVGKIQQALATIDGALIAADEARDRLYGRTTAAAVLAYKQARNIINTSYQRQADDIVGKMTIAALDREMAKLEQKPRLRCCTDPAYGGGSTRAGFVAEAVGDGAGERGRPTILSILIQLVRAKGELGPQSFPLARELWPRANELLQPFDMRVARVAGRSVDFPMKVKFDGGFEDFVGLRKAAEKEMPGFKPALRVLICPFRINAAGDDDTRTNAVSIEAQEGFDRFIVLNANTIRADRGTLLHEMIHCSDAALMSDASHDSIDSDSIFSWNANRKTLRAAHAQVLRRAFFAA